MQRRIRTFLEKLTRKQSALTVDRDAVTWGYRLFLDREPENERVISEIFDRSITQKDSRALRMAFMQSAEFRQKNHPYHAIALSGDEPSLLIEDVNAEAELHALFEHVQASWQHWGETEPYWSVLANEKFLQAHVRETGMVEEFYNTGKNDVSRIFKTLERNNIDYTAFETCLEYGCGLGRVTRWLAEHFNHVYGYDISRAHLEIAEKILINKSIQNVILKQVKALEDLKELPKADLIYSVIVLQHNPPPIIAFVIRQFLRVLNSGGVGLFQVPTYRLGYEFTFHKYLANEGKKRDIEMHVLPQNRIFEIVQKEGGKIIEVLEDGWTGLGYKDLSNTFLVQKT